MLMTQGIVSLNFIHHHKPQAWQTSGGKLGTLASPQAHKGHAMKFKYLDPRAIAQRAACDIYLQYNITCNKYYYY